MEENIKELIQQPSSDSSVDAFPPLTVYSSSFDLLAELKTVRWDVATKTYGNAHSTLIGLLVSWWISSGADRWALESGPSSGYKESDEKAPGRCDALFCAGSSALGLLEVEGSRHEYTAKKIGHFFRGTYKEIHSLTFAVFVVYQWSPTGRGKHRVFPDPFDKTTRERISTVSCAHPAKQIAVVTVHKYYGTNCGSLRARNDYFSGTPCEIRGFLFQRGQLTGECLYHLSTPNELE